MKIIALKIFSIFSLAIFANARTIARDVNNNQSNEIPREPFKGIPPRPNPQTRQNIPTEPQITITAANIQNLLSTSPIVQAFLSNSTVQTVLSDPIVQGVLRNPTVQNVLGNPIMQNILFDPAVQGLAMQTFLSSFTSTTTTSTTTTTTPLPPTTPPQSPFFQLLNTPPPRTSVFSSTQPAIIPQRPDSRPIIAQLNRPTTQQTLLTALFLGLDELINILQAQLATRNRNRIMNNGNGQRIRTTNNMKAKN